MFKNTTNDLLKKVHLTLQRISQAPIMTPRVSRSRDSGSENIERALQQPQDRAVQGVTLSKCPKTLYVLWQEYEFGLGGNKAAKLYTPMERGKNKFKYSLRKGFWIIVTNMIRGGHSHNTAIDRIYDVYAPRVGRTVTKILWEIRKDKTRQNCELRNYM